VRALISEEIFNGMEMTGVACRARVDQDFASSDHVSSELPVGSSVAQLNFHLAGNGP
jgi:hypothetical protein